MPIKGKVHAAPPDGIPDMFVGEIRYMPWHFVTVTRQALFFDLKVTVVQEEDIDEEEEYIKVTRLDEHLTADSFEFDFTFCSSQKEYPFTLDNEDVFKEFSADKNYLQVPISKKQLVIHEETELTRKQREHEEALRIEDYEKAHEILKEIKQLKASQKS